MLWRQRWTVSELTRYLREQFESDPRLQDTEVGEVSDRIPGSGHAYFTLKDADTLQCDVAQPTARHRGDLPKHGDRVIAEGISASTSRAGSTSFTAGGCALPGAATARRV